MKSDSTPIEEPATEKTKRVILWGNDDLFAMGVEAYLNEKEEWDVLRITKDHSFELLLNRVTELNPHVVIIHKGACNENALVPMLLSQHNEDIKIIIVSLENNLAEVISKKKVMVEHISDLLSIMA